MENTTQPSSSLPGFADKFAEPREVLIAARKLIEKPADWSGGSRHCGKYCAQTAIGSLEDFDANSPAQQTFERANGFRRYSDVWHWNDNQLAPTPKSSPLSTKPSSSAER